MASLSWEIFKILVILEEEGCVFWGSSNISDVIGSINCSHGVSPRPRGSHSMSGDFFSISFSFSLQGDILVL